MVAKQLKYAFTLIELIFAIVIIGIAVVSLPIISQVTSSSVEKNLVQEAILLTSANIVRAMSGKWDENSKPDNLDFAYIVYTSDAEVTASGGENRPGCIRILYQPDNTLRSTNGLEEGSLSDADDIDDYVTTGFSDAVTDIGSAESFKDKYKTKTEITQNASFGTLSAAQKKNLKKITITTQNSSGKDLVKLYMYVANTGSANSLKRTLP